MSVPTALLNTFKRYSSLVKALPPLVRKQRREAKKIAQLEIAVDRDKAIRAEIEKLLQPLGFKSNEGVTCGGYDVKHNERKGNTSYDVVLLGEIVLQKLVELGWHREDIGRPAQGVEGDEGYTPASPDYVQGAESWVISAIAAVKSVGETSYFATVKPMKGASVRQ